MLSALMKSLIPLPVRRSLGNWWNARQTRATKRRLLASLRGDAVACNVCGWQGARFTDDAWHEGTLCPNCGSQVRHRLLVAMLDGLADQPGLSEADLISRKDVLHFAPERQLRNRIQSAASRYTTADFGRGDCDLRLDISSMPSVQDASQDVLIACDVLEHVPHDVAAMREIHRVLKPGGLAILTVPQSDPPFVTDEDPSVISAAERESRFGQKDHVRMYGDDFSDRLGRTEFKVHKIDASHFSVEARIRYILEPPKKNPHPLATNHRRIYLAYRERKFN